MAFHHTVLRLSTFTQSTLDFFVFYMSKFGTAGVFGISVAVELIWSEKSKLASSFRIKARI